MAAYIARRILHAIPVLALTSVFVFLVLRLVPGDPALVLAGSDAEPEAIHAVRVEMGLDQPLPVQYLKWIEHVVRGDFGRSYISRLPTLDLLILKLPATFELTLAALALALLIAVPTGIVAAVRQRSAAELAVSIYTTFGVAVPNFWVGILFILLFALALGWLPPGGRVEFGRDPILALQHLILPALTLAIPQSAVFSRFLKAAVAETLQEDYVRTARAKGLAERLIVSRHVLRNALIPLVTVLGMDLGRLLGGAVLIEAVFAWPGIGRLMLQAIGDRDYTVVQGGLLLLVMTFVCVNLLTDISYAFLDPRMRLSSRRR